jgi:hypothetical protein
MPRPIRNGVDCIGYIVRPDYPLVRRRVVSRLKARLRDSEQKLVRPQSGYTLFRHDPVTLAGLRATWASYRAHLKMANSDRLWHRLVTLSGWPMKSLILRRTICSTVKPSRLPSISSRRISSSERDIVSVAIIGSFA